MDFGRMLTAMVTPFDKHNQIDFNITTQLVEHLIASGTDGLVVAGTTGESPTLSHQEKIDLFQHVIKVVNGRVPIIAGTGSNNTQASIELTKEAEQLGVDGALIVTPYYNKPNQEGLYQHFAAIAGQTKLPIMLYNIPSRAVVRLNVETVVALSQIDNIVSIKDSTGDLDSIASILNQVEADFTVYSGDDSLTLPIQSIGGTGIVSVSSHIIGKEMKEMIMLYEQGNVKEAAQLHRQLLPIMRALFMAPSPSPVKSALKYKDIDVGSVRLPLVPLSPFEEQNLFRVLDSVQ
ncbi:4-hydroxy-tetrahydrodipicolinate synthase [Gracilibacillus caseinilyticus]|uniref:4-hydroxy-tetrahydrodipicolinate synthase n=1 Tax=Gracilibacillus caseinilyticus TaxID=2932256 RepID=A0ABY4EU16_9BACI|nr:4-hydroxy-tetrahydrodipicolinate synthase [Gracilibacillus caseinilyticus]UOQ47820.1 4-hydroxy-tetrahydrodipicolinate synthase [Gracilibacillus caseinilyticus]